MITYIDKSNADLAAAYTQLFDDAEVALGDSTVIEDLPSYFQNLSRLARLQPKFMRIPLDEDVFDIDANKRLIKVPKTFATSGISVKDDEIAEIVYFKINRFFDAADLSTKKIVIAWENAAGEKGLTAAFQQDNVQDKNGEDFLVFGWPLDSRITKAVGTVKFAVRFYTLDKEGTKIDYSFSTIPASARILNTLEVDVMATETVDLSESVLARLSAKADFAGPAFTQNLSAVGLLGPEGTLALTIACEPVGEDIKQTVVWTKDGAIISKQHALTYTADAVGVYQAIVTNTKEIIDSKDSDDNKIAYHTESKQNKSIACVIAPANEIEILEDLPARAYLGVENAQLKLKIAKPNGELKIAVKKSTNGKDHFTAVSKGISTATEEVEGGTAITVTINVAEGASGYYKVELTNTLNKDTKTAESAISRVTPKAPVPTIALTYGGESVTGEAPVAIGNTLTAKVTGDAAKHSDSIAYQWYVVDSKTENEDPIKGQNKAEFKPVKPGKYYVKAINTLNESVSEQGKSAEIIVYSAE